MSSAVNARKSNASLTPRCEWAVSATAEDFVYVSYFIMLIVFQFLLFRNFWLEYMKSGHIDYVVDHLVLLEFLHVLAGYT